MEHRRPYLCDRRTVVDSAPGAGTAEPRAPRTRGPLRLGHATRTLRTCCAEHLHTPRTYGTFRHVDFSLPTRHLPEKRIMKVGPADEGNFVQTDLGLGRLVSVSECSAIVRFFRAPSLSPYVDREFGVDDLSSVALGRNTRVYQHTGRRWRIGRVEEPHSSARRAYVVAFPNGEGAVLPIEAFDVRWGQSVEDPFEILATVGGDTPLLYQCRADILFGWTRQQQAARGVEGLWLGSVELHEHQLEIVRRVSSDPVKRYLLADEVGLGKTVEAAALVRMFLQQHPEGRVLVLAPSHLRLQWAEELVERFRCREFDKAWVRIYAHDDVQRWPEAGVDLVVIDEAHHLTTAGGAPGAQVTRMRELAKAARDVLLLSATPVRSNETGFLELLHVLDPENYHLDDLASFKRRVEVRDQLAFLCRSLEDEELDRFDMTLYGTELAKLFPEDHRLSNLLARTQGVDDAGFSAAVRDVREHLSETYRLHHRLLRTRRTPELEATFSVRGRRRAKPFILNLPDQTSRRREDLIDSLRGHLSAKLEMGPEAVGDVLRAFTDLLARCGSLPAALGELLAPVPDPQSVVSLLADTLDEDSYEFIQRDIRGLLAADAGLALDALVAELSALMGAGRSRRLVVMTQFSAVADALAQGLSRAVGARRLASHLRSQPAEAQAAELDRWRSDNDCNVLICDAGAEEGLNLQAADLIVHVDLPWHTTRLEQRIGRCDRHAPEADGAVASLVVIYGNQSYADAWLEHLADTVRVFTRSVSSLQYVLSEVETKLHLSVLRAGHDALTATSDDLAVQLDEEQKRIVAHDALDAVRKSETGSLIPSLLAADRDRTIPRAWTTWIEGVGGHFRVQNPGVIELQARRLQVPYELEFALASALRAPVATDRGESVSRRLPILRAGHPALDAVAEHLMQTDRGVAFAVFRPQVGQWPPTLTLRTDFLLTVSLARLFAGAPVADSPGWLDRLASECWPARVVSIAMSAQGDPKAPQDKVEAFGAPGDLNLTSRPDLFGKVALEVDWEGACATALTRARAALDLHDAVSHAPVVAASALRDKVLRRLDQLTARANANQSGEDPRQVQAILDSLPESLPLDVVVLGGGVVVAADPSKVSA